ncbi:helix-turn-helix transcriptional regulator [Microbacterium caowuchunii]|uniref:WYL domain-containing protein n=1 Tax=Microbacterium caowuchunii TaxID=2614638 RepID=A0A5N0T5X6_9MICO|nr:WYL domain-containing protein [Microbacterium caowuchunii]KAA9130221.1 WYL domain-containing protein [Microbacterium caowuchunii]
MTTTSRLLNLLSLLQARRDWPGSLLASRLNISDRTVRRDIDRLREMGYSIQATMGPDGGYRLNAGSELPPLLFDDDQTVAVAIALQAAPAVGAGIEEAAIRALGTIRQVMPSRLRHRLDALEVTTIGRPGDAAPIKISLDILVTIANTIRDRETLRFDYEPLATDINNSNNSEQQPLPPRRVEPHHLVTSHGRWYLVGWDLDRDDWRLYRVDRVHPRIPHGPHFTPRTVPGGNVNEFVSARFKGSTANEWPCRGTVILHLPARDVLPFAGDGSVTAIDEQSCSLEAGSWSWGALAASFGRFEVPMEIVEPPELAYAFATLAERYATTSKTGPSQK